MSWKPHVTVAAVVEQDGRFLLVEESIDGRICFNQPAGHLEEGESLIEAVIRECHEETGWHFVPDALVGLYRWRRDSGSPTFLRFGFAGRCTGHDAASPLDHGILAAHWLTADEIRARACQLRSPLVQCVIDDYQAGQRFPLELLADVRG